MCLIEDDSNEISGYAISHPIMHFDPPTLDSLLGHIASEADTYYIHDLAILPQFQRRGFGSKAIDKILTIASRFPAACLISVYGTQHFWGQFGFVPVETTENIRGKLLGYGGDAVFLERCKEEVQP